ncbi:uncharacterized protein LOC113204810 [Frankliniella occidentalis]|uniref:Coactosin-like protein n=1 Tax=Frankliniella occidentalis TaxID=133901 RepID=A0A6J1S5H2_FRAOC|nr:uncharacterized protein LOC113204810 [Frankliniella occidentalis]
MSASESQEDVIKALKEQQQQQHDDDGAHVNGVAVNGNGHADGHHNGDLDELDGGSHSKPKEDLAPGDATPSEPEDEKEEHRPADHQHEDGVKEVEVAEHKEETTPAPEHQDEAPVAAKRNVEEKEVVAPATHEDVKEEEVHNASHSDLKEEETHSASHSDVKEEAHQDHKKDDDHQVHEKVEVCSVEHKEEKEEKVEIPVEQRERFAHVDADETGDTPVRELREKYFNKRQSSLEMKKEVESQSRPLINKAAMSTSVDEKSVREAYEDVRSDTTPTDWAVFKFEAQKIVCAATGEGFESFRGHFADDERAFGFIRIQMGDEMSKRQKFVFLTWVGPQVSVIRRAKMTIDKGLVKDIIKNFAVELQVETQSEINVEYIREQLARAGGANYGTGFRD